MILPLTTQLPNPGPPPKVGGKDLPPVPAPGTDGWAKVATPPETLVRRADARLNGLKNAISEWMATVSIPAGHGQSFGRDLYYAPGRFRIETLRLGRPEEQIIKLVWTGDNGRIRVLTDKGWESRPEFKALPQPLAPAFLLSFDSITKRATQGAKTFTTLLASARKLGYTTLVERRRHPKAVNESELRLLLTKGTTRYAISWNEQQMLPSQVWLQSLDAKGRSTRALWLVAWGVKRTPLTADDVKNYHPSSYSAKR